MDISEVEPMKTEEALDLARQTVARGWCHKDTEHKVMDVTLADAIAYEVAEIFLKLKPERN